MKEIQESLLLYIQNGYARLRQDCGGKIVGFENA
jgi:hypothetical protein